jgi:Ser/Thr protein kinase RdoA (MazF antagonist)
MNQSHAPADKKRDDPVYRIRQLRRRAFALALLSVVTMGAARGREPFRPEPESLQRAAPELIEQLRADPFAYFRFVNRPWIARVCQVFGRELRNLPVVRLHGDAHVEQFAITSDSWGIDDFDDSAQGPAVVDIVRFLGSVDLVARQRSWEKDRNTLFDRFVEGYKRGLAQPDHLPPVPDLVRRLRAGAPGTRAALLAWGDIQMQPLADAPMKAVVAAVEAFAQVIMRERPDLTTDYFRLVRAGWIQSGVGSAVSPKITVRVQGHSADPADDELLELKKIGDLSHLACLDIPALQPTVRIIDGNKQLGRLKYSIMASAPELDIPEVMARGQQLRDWWIRSLDSSYRQIRLADLHSIRDLAELTYDSGVQLGAGRFQGQTLSLGSYDRKRALTATVRLEKRYRQEASNLIDDLLGGWREIGGR